MTGGVQALVSVHDVMPETLEEVADVLVRLRAIGLPPVPLLVVPGRHWAERDMRQIRDWAEAGHELIAHGWVHRARHVRGFHHRLHALILSRDAAEHLALSTAEIMTLMQRSAAWFKAHELPRPSRYVPPAWALGRLPRRSLHQLPYRTIEITRGLLNTHTGRVQLLPLVGFDADTVWREHALRHWNRQQERLALRSGRPLRVCLHPRDFRLRLAGELDALLRRCTPVDIEQASKRRDSHWTRLAARRPVSGMRGPPPATRRHSNEMASGEAGAIQRLPPQSFRIDPAEPSHAVSNDGPNNFRECPSPDRS